MWFGYMCCHFFHIMNLVIFHPLYIYIYIQLVPLVSATPLIVLYRLLRNFACVFFMAWGYACGLDIIVRSFVFTFFHTVNVIFHPLYIDSGYLVSTTPHTILYQSF